MSFESEYENLLAKQYWEKDKARGEIRNKASSYKKIFEWLNSFIEEFDVDLATGDRLDILGRVVGIGRRVESIIPKTYFGFDDNVNSAGFDDKFGFVAVVHPFFNKFELPFTDLELNDEDFRVFIKSKIFKNVATPLLVSDKAITVQDAVQFIFNGDGYVVDNKDMTATLYVPLSFKSDILQAILSLNLIPKPQCVRYDYIVQGPPGETFGFYDNPNSLGFSNKFDTAAEPGGFFANKVIF